jgi:hypothetical protein
MRPALLAEWTRIRTVAGPLWLPLGMITATVALSAGAPKHPFVRGGANRGVCCLRSGSPRSETAVRKLRLTVPFALWRGFRRANERSPR